MTHNAGPQNELSVLACCDGGPCTQKQPEGMLMYHAPSMPSASQQPHFALPLSDMTNHSCVRVTGLMELTYTVRYGLLRNRCQQTSSCHRSQELVAPAWHTLSMHDNALHTCIAYRVGATRCVQGKSSPSRVVCRAKSIKCDSITTKSDADVHNEEAVYCAISV